MIQAIGPACSFLTVFAIARLGGPSDQGRFAQLRSWVDLLVVLGSFGFPQGLVFVINRLGASAPLLARACGWYALAFLPLALAGSTLAYQFKLIEGGVGDGLLVPAMLAAAAAGLVLHGLWRGIFLARDAGLRFAAFSILPAIATLAAVTITLLAGTPRFAAALLGAALIALLAGTFLIAPVLATKPAAGWRVQPWRALFTNGILVFLQAVLLAVQPVIAYRLVLWGGGEDRQVGFLNAGLFLAQGLAVPISMVAPLLFARWTSDVEDRLLPRLAGWTSRGLGAAIASAVLLAIGSSLLVPLTFGPEYRAAIPAVQAILATLPLVWHVRILAPALHARGRPGINTAAGAARLGTFVAIAAVAHLAGRQSVLAIAVAWSAGEIAGLAWTLLALHRLAGDGA